MRVLALVVAVLLLGVGVAVGWLGARETEKIETTTMTVTTTTTKTSVETDLPAPVDETRRALLAAAEAGDYAALRPYVTAALSYTFGGPVEGGPIAYWQELERRTGERPLEILASILRMPAALTRGVYVWPWAYTVVQARDLSSYERELLSPLGPVEGLFVPGTGYLGWRAGIEPDGTWVFFVAGD